MTSVHRPPRRQHAGPLLPFALWAVVCLSLTACQMPTGWRDTFGRTEATTPAAAALAAPAAVVPATGASPSSHARALSIAGDDPAAAAPAPSQHPVQLVEYQQPLDAYPELTQETELPEFLPSDGMAALTPDRCCTSDNMLSCMEQWRPPNLPGPWPYDEYLCDGGDRALAVQVDRDWTVRGIDTEDTVAHYDTRGGETVVTHSNCVCIYAPRFAAVRHTTAPLIEQHQQYAAGVDLPLAASTQDLAEGPKSVNQPVQAQRNLAFTPPYAFLERNLALGLEDVQPVQGIDFDLLPYENLAIIREGRLEASEKARLAELTNAAKIWEAYEGVEVLIGGKAANEIVSDVLPQEVIRYETFGKPCLQIVKIANKQNALPGDIVEFTLRFDNVGDETVGNVTILDSLTTRLEYVPDSAQCTRDADFFVVPNEGDSLILRWEIKEPLEVGQGGIIRFQCRVR